MKKSLKIIKITVISLLSLFVMIVLGLFVYTIDSYEPLNEMYDEIGLLNQEGIEIINDLDQISYHVTDPQKNIVMIPGGKVKPESYQYLAVHLALSGYDVTIVKPLFNLAILTPNYAAKFLRNDMDNIVIGHSLGGTVGSMLTRGDDRISSLVFLASYPISDVSDKNVLVLTAEFDLVLDRDRFEEYVALLPENYVSYEISGGNHAQFGWYGIQKGDGVAEISIKTQQDIIINKILDFLK